MGRVFSKYSYVIENFTSLFDQTTYFTIFDDVWDIPAPQGPLPVAMLAVRAFAVPWYRPARPEQHAYLNEMDGPHHGMCRWLNMLFSYSWVPVVSCAISCSSSCSQTKLGSYLSSSLAILSLLIKLPAEIYCSISGESKALLRVLAPRWRNCHYIDTIWVINICDPFQYKDCLSVYEFLLPPYLYFGNSYTHTALFIYRNVAPWGICQVKSMIKNG